MCGLVGMIGIAMDQDLKVMRDLLWLDKFRGKHSTGLAVIGKADNAVHLYKKVGTPDKMFNAYPDAFDDEDIYKGPLGKMWIGHNRAATRGKVSDENAHPFHHNTIVGAHNGTLKSVYQLEDHEKFEVDSEAIFYNLDKAFDNEKVIGKINGAYALVWYDNVTDQAHIIRNKERTLYWTRRKDSEVIYWASEEWMLNIALAYNNVQHDIVIPFQEDVMYTFDLSFKNAHDFKKTYWNRTVGVKGWVAPPAQAPLVTKTGGSTTSGGTSNAANPFPTNPPANSLFSHGSTSSQTKAAPNRTKEEKAAMKALQGKEIKFRFDRQKINEISNTPYLAAYFADPNIDYEIRIFGASNKDWTVWNKNCHFCTYTGTIKRMVENNVRGKKNCYLLLDMRTIKPVDPKMEIRLNLLAVTPTKPTVAEIVGLITPHKKTPPKKKEELVEEEMYEGFQGRYLTKEEWDKATEDGCSGCMKAVSPSDEGIVFIDHKQCLCGGCAQSDAYSGMLANFKN